MLNSQINDKKENINDKDILTYIGVTTCDMTLALKHLYGSITQFPDQQPSK